MVQIRIKNHEDHYEIHELPPVLKIRNTVGNEEFFKQENFCHIWTEVGKEWGFKPRFADDGGLQWVKYVEFNSQEEYLIFKLYWYSSTQ